MKELPRKQPPNVSGGIGNITDGPCTDTPYVPGKTPITDEPFPPTLPGPDYPPSPCEPTY